MADDDLDAWGGEGDWNVSRVDPDDYTVLVPQDINPRAYSKYPLQRLVQAAYDGDLELLEKMLDREDPISGYHHDINEHLQDVNALHAAAMNGQLEAVQLLLAARADPHIRQSMPRGRDPKDGETARDMADRWGWDDVVEVLRKAEEETPKGVYLRYGEGNNAKLWPIDRPEGLDPEQERRARRRHRGLVEQLPTKEDRKFYGDLVFGITHGWDEDGAVIKRPLAFAQGPAAASAEASGPFGGAGAGAGGSAPAAARMDAGRGDGGPAPRSRSPVGLLFPDQGAPNFAVVLSMQQSRKVQEMLDVADELLGLDVRRLIAGADAHELKRPEVSHPLAYLASLAALERLRESQPDAVESPGAVAGLAVGEFAALTAAGAISFKIGFRLVRERAVLVARAAEFEPQGMLSVAGIDKERLEELCAEASRESSGAPCHLASELFPKGCAAAGGLAALERLKALADAGGALQTKLLKGGGAVHTPLMAPARRELEVAVEEVMPHLRAPSCDVFMNATGRVVRAGTPPAQFAPLLCEQLTSRVLWDSCVRGMAAAGAQVFYEVGPGKQLKAMMKRVDQGAWSRTECIDS